jgi:hypothetical protein
MKTLFSALLIFAFASAPGYAQGVAGGTDATPGAKGSGGKHRNAAGAKTQEQKPKVDDKEYRSAIDRLPDQTFDPWKNAR